jgi:hypothetical protein
LRFPYSEKFCHKDSTNPQKGEFSSIRMSRCYDNCTGLYVSTQFTMASDTVTLVNFRYNQGLVITINFIN